MKAAIITIAGLSSRFNQDVPADEYKLKAIYHEADEHDTLLYHMIDRLCDADRIVLVSGYKQEELIDYMDRVLSSEIRSKIIVVYNNHYEDWSSGYSLYLGIQEALKYNPENILFAEGDLDVDDETFNYINESKNSVITCNHEIIRSSKAVIGYCDANGRYRYAFSTSHGLVSIEEPFSILFNSGQIWKFTDMRILAEANEAFERYKETGTNLKIVSDYFAKEDPERIEFVDFKQWVNCNTREDYRMILAGWEAKK